jgi:hypothetical protein
MEDIREEIFETDGGHPDGGHRLNQNFVENRTSKIGAVEGVSHPFFCSFFTFWPSLEILRKNYFRA